ncbi:phospholipase D family protein [Massilia sp. CF038]|uniref:phospholipase D family protein n=1 Tax=Massilia sp. CF038 TaxID=1881045 RepID=UPI000922755D|nr:phospholipase D family protein [Massilia sp. CF038]SHG65392.1 putative cardiolipin synthase [Massilia sp. CF038]
MRQWRALLAALVFAGALGLSGCAALPAQDGRRASHAIAGGAETTMGKALAPLTAQHPGLSGVHALLDGRDAFAARVMMANAAERSLDVQYYIWRNDTTGTLLFDALAAAARRGVRVRLLLDDNNTVGLDRQLALLDALPDLEVRLFNPYAMRSLRLLGLAGDFGRLNRRMHNKSFTADGVATIVGGRNVGDEYFDATGEVLFADLDVMAVGAVVDTVAQDFDRYWNSASAYPLAALVGAPPEHALAAQLQRTKPPAPTPAAHAYLAAIRASTFVQQLTERSLPFEWAPVLLVSDDPGKVLGQWTPETGLAYRLPELFGNPATQADLVSPYFVPGPVWSARFAVLSHSGIALRILTNSLEATDVAAVHAGYAKWRKPLVAAGVQLYELKRSWPRSKAPASAGVGGSSGSSLHAKTIAVDQKRLFVGSFNFDYRSADLNTEMGFVIDSPAMAARMAAVLSEDVPARAYQVKLSPEGALYWIEATPDGPLRHDTEPGTSWWRRMSVGLLSLLPIDWLL